MSDKVLGIIGGSGLYDLEGLEQRTEEFVQTPYGKPSSAIVTGVLNGTPVVFISRHNGKHVLTPDEVPYQANILALKAKNVTHLLSFTAVGSLREDISPGDFVITNQFIDNAKGRPNTLFGEGLVGHVSMADPICFKLGDAVFVAAAAKAVGTDVMLHNCGTYVVINGPQFSTRAESLMYRNWGADIIGMTAMPEAKLAREAEFCYVNVAMVTDYDCWREGEHVTAEEVVKVMSQNVSFAKSIITGVAAGLPERDCPCENAVQGAIMTKEIAKHPNWKQQAAFRKYVPRAW